MIDQRKRIFAVSLWLLDLLLTMISFFLAYRLRLLVAIPGYTVMKVQVYLWLLVNYSSDLGDHPAVVPSVFGTCDASAGSDPSADQSHCIRMACCRGRLSF